MSRVPVAASLVVSYVLLTVSCSSPVSPTSSMALDQFVEALRQQGLGVSLGGQISPSANGFFSVPAQQVRVNDANVNAFVYQNAQSAAAEAAGISQDGQPSSTTRVSWVSHAPFLSAGCLDCALRRVLGRDCSSPSSDRRRAPRGRSHAMRACEMTVSRHHRMDPRLVEYVESLQPQESRIFVSWNLTAAWLRKVDTRRRVALKALAIA